MTRQRPTVGIRGVGMELHAHRKAAKLSCETVAKRLGVSASTISRIESGRRDPTSEEVASILTVIGITGIERERLIDQARRSPEQGLLETTTPTVQSRTYRNFEARAAKITDVELLLIPGLAQTPDYAHAVISAILVNQETDTEIEARVARRISRQAILTRKNPPQLHLIITEAALRLPLGGAKLMARQVRHLVELTERPNISINVIPARVVGHAGLDGQFVILDFTNEPTIVHLEARTTGLFLDSPDEVAAYKLVVEKLMDVALDEPASVQLMASIARDLDRE